MKRAAIFTAFVTGTALIGAGYLVSRRDRPRVLPANIVPIITPVIDLGVAENVLAALDPLPGDEVTLVVHTSGGCVTSCVMIANALQRFERSTAIVPYMAMSGGTLIALSAKRLKLGRSASLSAVDPIIDGQRVKHLADEPPTGLVALMREYEVAMRRYVQDILAARMPGASAQALEQALAVFMGAYGPHEWPIQRPQLEALGLSVATAERFWAGMVDGYRSRWW